MKLDAVYVEDTVIYTKAGFVPQWKIVADANGGAPFYTVYDIPSYGDNPIEVGCYLTLAMAIKFAVQFK